MKPGRERIPDLEPMEQFTEKFLVVIQQVFVFVILSSTLQLLLKSTVSTKSSRGHTHQRNPFQSEFLELRLFVNHHPRPLGGDFPFQVLTPQCEIVVTKQCNLKRRETASGRR